MRTSILPSSIITIETPDRKFKTYHENLTLTIRQVNLDSYYFFQLMQIHIILYRIYYYPFLSFNLTGVYFVLCFKLVPLLMQNRIIIYIYIYIYSVLFYYPLPSSFYSGIFNFVLVTDSHNIY